MTRFVSFGPRDAQSDSGGSYWRKNATGPLPLFSARQDGYAGLRALSKRLADRARMRLIRDVGLKSEEVSGRRVCGDDQRRKPMQLRAKTRGKLPPFIARACLAGEGAQLHAVTVGR